MRGSRAQAVFGSNGVGPSPAAAAPPSPPDGEAREVSWLLRAPQPPQELLTSPFQQQSLLVALKRERKCMTKSWRKRLGELLQLEEPALVFPTWAVSECPGTRRVGVIF